MNFILVFYNKKIIINMSMSQAADKRETLLILIHVAVSKH